MSHTFTKLFSSITESTIWVEDAETRIVWITMLAMADKRGRVWGSIPGLANRARVSVEACERAMEKFQSPDKYSRTPDNEGRRIAVIDGGWLLLNYLKYRSIRDDEEVREKTAERVRNHREQKEKSVRKPVTQCNAEKRTVTPRNDNAEAEAEAELLVPNGTLSGSARRDTPKEAAKRVLAFLNDKTGKAFQPTTANLELIVARLKEGYDEDTCRSVIARKFREWKDDDKMRKYLRPATLFNREKFNQYAGECV